MKIKYLLSLDLNILFYINFSICTKCFRRESSIASQDLMSCRLGTPRSPLGKSAWVAAAPTPLPLARLLAARQSRGTVVIVTSADLTAFHASSQARKSLYETNRPSRRILIL